MSKEFKVGDNVSHPMWGNGEVELIDFCFTTLVPVVVRFESGRGDRFTQEGKWSLTDIAPSLHHGHGTFEIKFTPEPEPVFEWQWLLKDENGKFTTTNLHYKNENEVYDAIESDRYKVCSRIEESKREVKP